ncbi:MAG: hypothetical protein JXB39_12205 [Deltaproteobacteria bacterium]|nr:hypothetical protein [Deltaproteobacteria bacterium]
MHPCAWALAVLASCSPESRGSLQIPVHLAGSDPATFVGSDGAEVRLDRALLVLSDLRLESPPTVARLRLPSPLRSAWAHPGHDFSGDTACELLGTWELDLLSDSGLDPGNATCLEGDLATGRVRLSAEPALDLAGEVTLEGGEKRSFHFEVFLDEEVAGIPIEARLDADAPPALLDLAASPATMLSWSDWSTEDEDQDGLLTLSDGALGNTVPFGVVSTASFTLDLDE